MALAIVDVFEQRAIEDGLRRCGIDVVRRNLVPHGLGDIFWLGYGGARFTQEHKTIQQVVSEMGKRLDVQLRKHSQHADDVSIIVDGVATPNMDQGGILYWKQVKAKNGKELWVKSGESPVHYEALTAYLWRLEKEGFDVHVFANLDALCLGVASFIFNSLKAEHSTLKRYAKTKPVMWEPSPHKQLLMSLPSAKIGERTAEKILEHWGTPYTFFSDRLDTMCEVIGKEMALRVLNDIGR